MQMANVLIGSFMSGLLDWKLHSKMSSTLASFMRGSQFPLQNLED